MEELATRLNALYDLYDPFGYGDLFGGVDEDIIHKAFLDAFNATELEDTKEWLKEIIENTDADSTCWNEASALLREIV